MKTSSLHYFPVSVKQTAACADFKELDDFVNFIVLHQLRDVYVLNDEHTPFFAIMHNNMLLRLATNGFKTIDDYQHSLVNEFPSAEIYYKAKKAGYNKFGDYDMMVQAGITDRETFNKIIAGDFVNGYAAYMQMIGENNSLPAAESITNPYTLYIFATENGFKDFNSFKNAILRGFASADVLAVANGLGFTTFEDYTEAMQKGFRDFKDLEMAREKNIRDGKDFQKLIDLEFITCNDCTQDKKVLIALLSKLEQGKKISLNKLKELLKRALEEYRYQDTNEMPLWFTVSLNNENEIGEFLQKNEQVKRYGNYDVDGEYFEMNRLRDRKVVIDGSNVAHNSNGNTKPIPHISNIISMVNYLKSKGFTEITVINDASLKHKIADADKLAELQNIAELLEAPKENPADPFIIQYVKRNHCLLVSNDTFREWKYQDPWIAENIDFYRLAFIIKDENILMPDLN